MPHGEGPHGKAGHRNHGHRGDSEGSYKRYISPGQNSIPWRGNLPYGGWGYGEYPGYGGLGWQAPVVIPTPPSPALACYYNGAGSYVCPVPAGCRLDDSLNVVCPGSVFQFN